MAETDWEPFYKELIGIVQSYRYDRTGLLSKLKEIMDKTTEIKYEEDKRKWEENHPSKKYKKVLADFKDDYPTLGKDSKGNSNIKLGDDRITDIDPFTFISCLNNGKNEIKYHGEAAHDVFNMTNPYPPDYDFGIPIIPAEVKCFVWYEENGNADDYLSRIEYCWDLFDWVNNYVTNPDSYKDQFASLLLQFKNMTGKGIVSASIMFFLVSPENFVSLDEHTKEFIENPENDFSKKITNYLNGFSDNSNEFNLEYYLNFCSLLKNELNAKHTGMDFKGLVYHAYEDSATDENIDSNESVDFNFWTTERRNKISNFFTSNKFNNKYADLNVNKRNGNCNFASRNRNENDNFYWINPRKDFFSKTWYIVLHDDLNFIIYFFKVPANSINPDLAKDHNGKNNVKNLTIKYRDRDFPDSVSHNAIKLKDYLVETIPYYATNKIYYGIPGSGKSQKIKDEITDKTSPKYYKRILFHPDYTYSDFVGQILPKRNGEEIDYEFVPGPFTSILKDALNDKAHMHYLIIEEINRGNAPAIFGDVFQLLDRDEKGQSTYSIINADISYEIYKSTRGESDEQRKTHEIKIPNNLTIIATMNTSDQNVFTLDTAFKRRWEMKYIEDVFKDDDYSNKLKDTFIPGTNICWGKFHDVIDNVITQDPHQIISTEDKRLGCYFATSKELSNIDSFTNKVIRYLWDDVAKTNKTIFKPDIKTFDDIYKKRNDSNFLDSIFSERIISELKPEDNGQADGESTTNN